MRTIFLISALFLPVTTASAQDADLAVAADATVTTTTPVAVTSDSLSRQARDEIGTVITPPAAAVSAGDLTTGSRVAAGRVFTADAEADALADDLRENQREFLEAQERNNRPFVDEGAERLGDTHTVANLSGGADRQANVASGIPAGGEPVFTSVPVGTTTAGAATVGGRTGTTTVVGGGDLQPALVSREEAAGGAPAETVTGRVVSVDRPRNEVTVSDDFSGTNRTVRVDSALIASIEEGSVVKVSLRAGTDAAESIVVREASER